MRAQHTVGVLPQIADGVEVAPLEGVIVRSVGGDDGEPIGLREELGGVVGTARAKLRIVWFGLRHEPTMAHPTGRAVRSVVVPDFPETPLATLPFDEVTRRFESTGGVQVATYDWGGDGPPLVFVHATGLHAHVWVPLAQRLRSTFHCYAVDLRAQGETGAGNPPALDWENGALDFVAALDGLKLSGRGDVYGVGHSLGGHSIYQGELRRPGTFRHLFGFEPVTFPASEGGQSAMAEGDNLMAKLAHKRREVFPSRRAAYDNYRSKPPFSLIDDDALRSYVQWGFDDLNDGTVRLKCRAEHEAAIFSNSFTDTLERLPQIGCKVTLGLAEFTNEGFLIAVPMQAEQLRHGTLLHFPGRTHFGILERIDEMAAVIRDTFAVTGG